MNTGSSLDHCGAKYRRQMYRLRSYHWNGGRAGDVARLRTSLIDSLVRDAVEAFPTAGPQPAEQTVGQSGGVAWLAVGEYGRQQLAPFSPVEILVIGRTGKWAAWGPLRERVETCLRSAGIEFQLQMVPLKECLQLAQAGIDFCLSLLAARVIQGEIPVEELLESRIASVLQHSVGHGTVPRIRLDHDISSHSTVIEVQAQDRLGLGYQVARTLADLGLNILFAKLSTEKNHSLDVFYTQTREGEKITGSFQMTEIVERLRRQLSPERT